ncbi:uncharacterized protein LOC128199155 [Bicyclus anynana]|uniref:Uncharacterized protein LOC128199155 n=1 Tax=Bicyclus anynana TaxID=110368 RepID=A0ABM3LW39_BICAN|nr:uncharacterized protein LOC128199155 [Bicyclus anynana]
MARLCLLLIICYFAVVIAKGGGRSGGGRGRSSSSGRSSHSYPSSNSLSGNSAGTGHHTNAHTYPESTGISGNNHKSPSYTQKSEVHHHYHYFPPKQISYGSQQHPVFVGNPPSYVYVYKNSGSRFDTILTGLALYNLGRWSTHSHHSHRGEYSGTPGEVCKLGISKSNGEYEETRIDCKLMSSFIWDAEREREHIATKTTTNVTQITNDGNSTVIIQNTTVKEALQDKGTSIKVTPDMRCFMIHIGRDSSMLKKNVECGLLQEYAAKSLRLKYYTDRCARMVPAAISLVITFIIALPG